MKAVLLPIHWAIPFFYHTEVGRTSPEGTNHIFSRVSIKKKLKFKIKKRTKFNFIQFSSGIYKKKKIEFPGGNGFLLKFSKGYQL